jgi:hypothetical protein
MYPSEVSVSKNDTGSGYEQVPPINLVAGPAASPRLARVARVIAHKLLRFALEIEMSKWYRQPQEGSISVPR